MNAALRKIVAAPGPDDAGLRDRLEALAQKPRFAEFTWLWGPALAERGRVLFRPFILSHFSSVAVNGKGELFDPWRGDTAALLERWLGSVDAADDIELTRRLYGWRLSHTPWKTREAEWREDVVRRFSSAESPAGRFAALAKVDTGWLSLDAGTAEALYDVDRTVARSFILKHLPGFGWRAEKRQDWEPLLEKSRGQDPDFHFDLYRRIVDDKRWRRDVLALCREIEDPERLDAELERRHPLGHVPEAADVFLELVQARERAVVAYVIRHVRSVFPRWGFGGRREAKSLPALLALADERGWLDLWSALLRTSATAELFDAEVKRLVRSKTLPAADVQRRLALIAGPGREAHFPGISLVQVQPLTESTALELYRRFPAFVQGPFRMHVAPGWQEAYPRLVQAAIDAGDTELVDFFAARAGIQVVLSGKDRDWNDTVRLLSSHFEALDERDFVSRAASALSRMPAYAVWNYDELLRSNSLARLLFERSTALYLSDGAAVRDLLESPQIHVQLLAFRILGSGGARAREIAAQNADLLQATLFRRLQRRTRLLAFKALENAARHDEATARYLLGRMRDALALPEKRYPTEKLVGLIAAILHAWPPLRTAGEVPHVYGEVGA